MKWEQIDNDHQRCKVPGGWLVKAYESVAHKDPNGGMNDGWDWRVAMCFMPDPDHHWNTRYDDRCDHGIALDGYCEPCGRVYGG